MKKELNLKRLQRNIGEQLTTLYGCSSLHLPKGEKVLEREEYGPDNSFPNPGGGWNGQKITTNKRVIKVEANYMTGDTIIIEV